MRKLLYIFIAINCLSIVSCSDDDEQLKPSGEEKNWFVIEDSDDPIDHLRYEIFQSLGVPVYYNDTIGSMIRYNFKGQPYTYYEVLQAFYIPGTTKPSANINYYRLLPREEKSQLSEILEGIRDRVLEPLRDKIYIPSILLVDTLETLQSDLVYRGFNTVVVGGVLQFGTLSSGEQEKYLDTILSSIVAYDVYANFPDYLEQNFYVLSEMANPQAPAGVYDVTLYKAVEGSSLPKEVEALGFLEAQDPRVTSIYAMKTPTYQLDVAHFCNAIFLMSENEFLEKYAGKEIVLEKYQVMKAFLNEMYGFVFENE